MGVQSQKKNLLDAPQSGSSPKKVARKIKIIFAEKNPTVNLDDVNREFGKQYGIFIFSLCEIWHQMRIHNHMLDVVAQAFAAKLSHISAEKHHLEEIIVAQRSELAKKDKHILGLQGLPKTAVEAEIRQANVIAPGESKSAVDS